MLYDVWNDDDYYSEWCCKHPLRRCLDQKNIQNAVSDVLSCWAQWLLCLSHVLHFVLYILLLWIIVYIYARDPTYSDMYIYIYTFNMISCLSTYTILKTTGHFYILYLLLSGHSGDVWLSLRRAPVSWPRSSAEHLGFDGETMRIFCTVLPWNTGISWEYP